MTKPILRKNRDGSYVIYRAKTNQGIILTVFELVDLGNKISLHRMYTVSPLDGLSLDIPVTLGEPSQVYFDLDEKHRQITATDKGIEIGEMQGDLFSD